MPAMQDHGWPEDGGTVPTAGSVRDGRYVFVTPYYRENRHYIERCIASVKHQTVPADHILIADGFPQDWIDQTNVRQLRLDRAHHDYGNTPRAIGSLMAVAEEYDGIGFLDADCWLEPHHLEHCLERAEQVGFERCGFVAALRILRRPDESVIEVPDEPVATHVDTSCLFLLPRSFSALPVWILMPRQISAICDRVFHLALRSRNLLPAFGTKQTVNFTYSYASVYRILGEAPPEPIKENTDHAGIRAWIRMLPAHRLEAINRSLGVDLRKLYWPKVEAGPPDAKAQNIITARAETMQTFFALAKGNGWTPSEAFEHAIAALEAALVLVP